MTDIEPGDLIRLPSGGVFVAEFSRPDQKRATLIAKGPGWTRHDGSSVNPVPGDSCEIYVAEDDAYVAALPSQHWQWGGVGFYRVTKPAPAPAPKIKPGSRVTVELCCLQYERGMAGITFPSGWTHFVDARTVADLPWQPPAPVLRVGGRALAKGTLVNVRALDEGWAMIRWPSGTCGAILVSDLTPLEDEG